MSFTVDWDAALASVNNDRSLLKLVIDAFLDESKQLLERIPTAIDTRDADLLKRTGHTLKGTMLSLGAAEWSAVARQIEELGATGSTEGADALFIELSQRLPELWHQLKTFTV